MHTAIVLNGLLTKKGEKKAHEVDSLIRAEVHFTVVLALRGWNWEPFHSLRHLSSGQKCRQSWARLSPLTWSFYHGTITLTTAWLELCLFDSFFLMHTLTDLSWQQGSHVSQTGLCIIIVEVNETSQFNVFLFLIHAIFPVNILTSLWFLSCYNVVYIMLSSFGTSNPRHF